MRNFLFLVIFVFAFGCDDDESSSSSKRLDARLVDVEAPLEDSGASDASLLEDASLVEDSDLPAEDAELPELDAGEVDAEVLPVADMSLEPDMSELSDAQLDASVDILVDM